MAAALDEALIAAAAEAALPLVAEEVGRFPAEAVAVALDEPLIAAAAGAALRLVAAAVEFRGATPASLAAVFPSLLQAAVLCQALSALPAGMWRQASARFRVFLAPHILA